MDLFAVCFVIVNEYLMPAHVVYPNNNLKERLGLENRSLRVDRDDLKRAEEAVSNLQSEFVSWAQADMKKLQTTMLETRRKPENWPDNAQRLFRIAHEIKGLSGTFGFDLMSMIGDRFCRFIENNPDSDKREILIKAASLHVDSLQLILDKQLQGDGGAEGMALLKGIDSIHRKLEAGK